MSTLSQFFRGSKSTRNISIGGAKLTVDPLLLLWWMSTVGSIAGGAGGSGNYGTHQNNPVQLSDARAWAFIDAKAKPSVDLVGGGAFETVLDITNKEVVLTNIIFPALAAANDTMRVKIVVDGVEYFVDAKASQANDRLCCCQFWHGGFGYNTAHEFEGYMFWGYPSMPVYKDGGIFYTGKVVATNINRFPLLHSPRDMWSDEVCLYASESLRIEVQSSAPYPAAPNNKAVALYLEF